MKKFYLLSLLCCISLAAFSQITTTIYATGASGSFITGYASSTGLRTDGSIIATNSAPTRRGYAVFDISSAAIPAGSTIMSVTAGYNVSSYTAGVTTVCSTNVYVGDLSLVTVPLTLYADMTTPTAINVSTVSYGAGTGNRTITSTPAAVGVVQSNLTGKLSWCWTNTGSAMYTIAGETGSASTSAGGHAPYLQIVYCPPPTSVSATATPNPVCASSTLTLTGSASVSTGSLSYQWTGPGGYTGAGSTATTSTPAAGVYTLTAVNTCGVATASTTATTASVTVNPRPAPISGATALCTTGSTTTTLTDADAGGTWMSSDPTIATISTTGDVTAGSAGTATITYTLPTGCYITSPMTVNTPPAPITGPTEVCEASSITLATTSTGGAWSATGAATVGASTGVVTGSAGGGPSTISYTIPGCAAATYAVTVNPLPATILGPASVCETASISLTETSTGGAWTSSDATVASVGSTGTVTGGTPGSATITYTLPTGCYVTHGISVNIQPAAISGPTSVCIASSVTLTDATSGGGWFSSDATVAPVTIGGGVVSGSSVGTATITFRVFSTGCFVTAPMTVYPLPAAITGPASVCANASITLSDSDPGGTWSSASTATATVGSLTGVVTGVAAGIVNISYTIPTGCSAVASIRVNAAPAAIITPAGPTTFCSGGSVLLNASPGAGNTYQWFNTSGPIAGATTISYTASTSDTFRVQIVNVASCSTTSAPLVVSAALSPVITSSKPVTSFCNGDNVVLTANTGGAMGTITYQWQRNGTDIPMAVGPSYVVTTSGSYVCIVSVSGGASGSCVAATPPDTITVYALPTPSISYNGVSLTTTSTYPAYQWFLNTVAISGATARNYTPTVSGSYQVRVTDGHTCSGYSTALSLYNVGVAQITKEDIRIFPNPAGNTLHIESPVAVRAVIAGMEGKTIIDVNNARELNLSSLSSGIYMIVLYDENGTKLMVDKLIKE